MSTGVISFGFGSTEQLVQTTKPQHNFAAKYSLYNGEIELLFDADAHRYFVRIGDKEPVRCPGVTDISGTLHKAALPAWSAKVCAEAIIAAMEGHSYQAGDLRRIHDTDFEQFVALVMEAKGEHTRISQTALDIGHVAHDWLENLQKLVLKHQTTISAVLSSSRMEPPTIKAEVENVDAHLASLRIAAAQSNTLAVRNCCNAATEWMLKHNFRPIRVENKIYSRIFNYAGTFDCLGLMDSCEDGPCCTIIKAGGRTERLHFRDLFVLNDWKSSKALYSEYRLQLAAYVQAWLEENAEILPQLVPGKTTIEGRVVTKLDKETGDFAAYFLSNTDQDADFAAFLGLMTPYERIMEIEEMERSARNLERSLAKAEKAEKEAAEAQRKAHARALAKAEREHKLKLEEEAKALKAQEKAAAKAAKETEKAAAKALKDAEKEAKKKAKETVQ